MSDQPDVDETIRAISLLRHAARISPELRHAVETVAVELTQLRSVVDLPVERIPGTLTITMAPNGDGTHRVTVERHHLGGSVSAQTYHRCVVDEASEGLGLSFNVVAGVDR